MALFELDQSTLGQINEDVRQELEGYLQVDLTGDDNFIPVDPEIYIDVVYIQGLPWVGEGSPWVGEGSASSSGPNPTGLPNASPPVPEPNDAFWSQWAFSNLYPWINISSIPDSINTYISHGDDSNPLRIGIFDTSPFTQEAVWNIARDVRAFQLCITRPQFPISLAPDNPCAPDLREHGLFGASLANAVEPYANLHLIRVLNDYGMGDLFTLAKSMNTFLQRSLEANFKSGENTRLLQGTVLNLSLGFTPAISFPNSSKISTLRARYGMS